MQAVPERLSPSGMSRRGDAGWRPSLRVTGRHGDAGRRRLPRVAERFFRTFFAASVLQNLKEISGEFDRSAKASDFEKHL